MRVIVNVKPNTLWAGAESLNLNRRLRREYCSRGKSLPMVRPAPVRQLCKFQLDEYEQAQPDHRPSREVRICLILSRESHIPEWLLKQIRQKVIKKVPW